MTAPTPPGGQAGGAAWPADSGRLLRAILNAARTGHPVQDRIDAAELALVLGHDEIARTLYGLVALRLGATAAMRTLLGDTAARTGWWTFTRIKEPVSGLYFSIDMAIAELRGIMASCAVPFAIPGGIEAASTAGTAASAMTDLTDMAARAGKVSRQLPEALDQGHLHALLQPLLDAMPALPPIHVEAHLGLEPNRLVDLLALEQIRAFVMQNWELLNARSTTSLLDATASLDPAALGCFFGNVGMLLRDHHDLLSLIDAAAGENVSRDDLEFWSLLLSAHLKVGQVEGLVEELGDRGMVRALRGILARSARTGTLRTHFGIVRRIRDAGIDLGDLALGADAQALIAGWRRTDGNEWYILGLIQGAMARLTEAEAAFSQALLLQPDDDRPRVSRSLMAAGHAFVVEHGFESSPYTYRKRLAVSGIHRPGNDDDRISAPA